MKASTIKRLPETRSLSQILPKGTEGGKEFARIVDLLLFYDARRTGRNHRLFSDASGDYNGLDSFTGHVFRRDGIIGYQYKFFQSPLSNDHRNAIKESLVTAAKARKRKNSKLHKWILVTPDDFTESATKAEGGDVSWFEGLKNNLNLPFEIEHWGHRHLQSLFIETRSLCLFYYPELVADGKESRRSITATRKPYDDNLLQLYRRIEFVGMSVYKPEATRGVPMEDIYIPVSTVPNSTAYDDDATPRTDPLDFLAQGRRQVILGDPGSGKSTLLRFLALVGCSTPLQKRCNAMPDLRLPILVILRKYATELKKSRDLPLLDYIIQSVKADFSLSDAGQDFFEYYLESGQAILLFDGLDELGSSDLKRTVRDRIQSLATTYPGNTVIVTSRIVGYDAAFGFDEKEYAHHRVGRLRKPEITQFVEDWYRARIENAKERDENAADLIRVLTQEAHAAIQDLSRNPLLLTIIALVHRIDAVLPDERVVLYQKCTETLLNTWHTWKFRDVDVQKRGKTERRNRQRIEAIAHWMQTRPRTNSTDPRAIVKRDALTSFLASYIESNEPVASDEDTLDMADDFIEFVRQRAGLLIEVGDNQFSFVHLTFQEYLTASWFKTRCEKDGVQSVWKSLDESVCDSTWHEVVRLLVASLTSDEAQEVMTMQLVKAVKKKKQSDSLGLLIAGLLLDGVEAAEDRRKVILSILLDAAATTTSVDTLRKLILTVRACDLHDDDCRSCFDELVRSAWSRSMNDATRLPKLLALLLAGRRIDPGDKLPRNSLTLTDNEKSSLRLLSYKEWFNCELNSEGISKLKRRLTTIALHEVTVSIPDNFVGTALPMTLACVSRGSSADALFSLSAFTLQWLTDVGASPFKDFYRNYLFMALSRNGDDLSESLWRRSDIEAIERQRSGEHRQDFAKRSPPERRVVLSLAMRKALNINRHVIKGSKHADTANTNSQAAVDMPLIGSSKASAHRLLAFIRENPRLARELNLGSSGRTRRRLSIIAKDSDLGSILGPLRGLDMGRASSDLELMVSPAKEDSEVGGEPLILWERVIRDDQFRRGLSSAICALFELEPRLHVTEAIEKTLLPLIPQFVPLATRQDLDRTHEAFVRNSEQEEDISSAAFLLMLDSAMWMAHVFDSPTDSRFNQLAEITRSCQDARLRFAHCIRDLAYGNEQREMDLVNMVKHGDVEMRRLLVDICWIVDKNKLPKNRRG